MKEYSSTYKQKPFVGQKDLNLTNAYLARLYTILFHYQANYPVSRKQRTNLEECFDNFIDASLYWGLIDFNSETAKYLQEQIDFPRETYVRELNNKK